MSEGKGTVFFGGIPTEPDVKKLINTFDVRKMTPGCTIEYSEVAEVIEQKKDSSRWRTVTSSWRKRLEKDHGIFLDCDSVKQAFCVLSEGGKVGLSGRKLRSAVSAARRSYIISGQVDVKQLNEDEKRNHEFYTMRSGNVIASVQLRSGRNTLPEMTSK
jgi:hypothetical protein